MVPVSWQFVLKFLVSAVKDASATDHSHDCSPEGMMPTTHNDICTGPFMRNDRTHTTRHVHTPTRQRHPRLNHSRLPDEGFSRFQLLVIIGYMWEAAISPVDGEDEVAHITRIRAPLLGPIPTYVM